MTKPFANYLPDTWGGSVTPSDSEPLTVIRVHAPAGDPIEIVVSDADIKEVSDPDDLILGRLIRAAKDQHPALPDLKAARVLRRADGYEPT